MNLTHILDDCLLRLAAGQSRAEVLALYPEQAHRLAPMLDAAVRLAALSEAHLSDPQKLRSKVALRQAIAEQAAPRPRFTWLRLRTLPAAFILAAMLVIMLSVSAIASSRPGDRVYPLRIAVERVPILVQFTPAGRASAELNAADRRLADLSDYLTSAGQPDPLALGALLEGDEAAAGRAAGLVGNQRTKVAARIATHADELDTLAGSARDPAAAAELRSAAERTRQLAKGLGQGSPAPAAPSVESAPASGSSSTPPEPPDTPAPPGPTTTPTLQSASATPSPRPTEATDVAPSPTPTPADTVRPTRTPRPRLWLTVTAPPPIATLLPDRRPRPTRTPAPGSTATAAAPVATRNRPTGIMTRVATLLPPRPTRTPQPGLTPLPTRTPWRPVTTPLPTRTPPPAWTRQPTRPPWVSPAATRVRPWLPPATPMPTDAPTPTPAETPVPTPVETPTADAALAATQTPFPEPTTPPSTGPHTPGPRP